MLDRICCWMREMWCDICHRLFFHCIVSDIEQRIQCEIVDMYKNQLLLRHQKDQLIRKAIDICKRETKYDLPDVMIDPNEWYDGDVWRGYYIDLYDEGLYKRIYIKLHDDCF